MGFSTLQEPLDAVSVTISIHVTLLFHQQVLNASLFGDIYCLNCITHSSVSFSFADTVTQAVIGLLAYSYKPNKESSFGTA